MYISSLVFCVGQVWNWDERTPTTFGAQYVKETQLYPSLHYIMYTSPWNTVSLSFLPLMLLGNHWPTGKFPILRYLVYVHHPVEVAGIELTTFGLRDTTTTVSSPDEDNVSLYQKTRKHFMSLIIYVYAALSLILFPWQYIYEGMFDCLAIEGIITCP